MQSIPDLYFVFALTDGTEPGPVGLAQAGRVQEGSVPVRAAQASLSHRRRRQVSSEHLVFTS